jgi:hypothetical protein
MQIHISIIFLFSLCFVLGANALCDNVLIVYDSNNACQKLTFVQNTTLEGICQSVNLITNGNADFSVKPTQLDSHGCIEALQFFPQANCPGQTIGTVQAGSHICFAEGSTYRFDLVTNSHSQSTTSAGSDFKASKLLLFALFLVFLFSIYIHLEGVH